MDPRSWPNSPGRFDPDRGVAWELAVIKWCAARQHLARRKRDGLCAEIGHAPYAAASFEMQHRQFRLDPAEVGASEQVAAERECPAVEIERRVGIGLLNAHRVRAEPIWLWQVRRART